MTQSICFWGFIGGTIGMVLRSYSCHLDGSLAEPTHSAAWGYKTGVQMWSVLLTSSTHIWSMVLLVWSWEGAEQNEECEHLRCTHLLCQSLYRFNTGSRHLNQLRILLLCKQSWCSFQFYIFTQKSSVYMWVIEKASSSTVWYDCSLIVVFRLCNFIKMCRVQFLSIISAFKIPTELNLQEA